MYDMTVLARITKVLLLFALMVPMSCAVRAQDVDEDFKAFMEQFVGDCEFQKSRVAFPLIVILHDEEADAEVVIDEADWECVDFSKFSVNAGLCIEHNRAGEQCFTATVVDTGILVEYRFVLVAGKWYLKRVEDYSM